jgi:hypothetical protein
MDKVVFISSGFLSFSPAIPSFLAPLREMFLLAEMRQKKSKML